MQGMEITEQLASALHDFVQASDAAEKSPSDRQTTRRVIEQSKLVAYLAKHEGFGVIHTTDDTEPDGRT